MLAVQCSWPQPSVCGGVVRAPIKEDPEAKRRGMLCEGPTAAEAGNQAPRFHLTPQPQLLLPG